MDVKKNYRRNADVVILCGGRGERLRPIIKDKPKPMCEFGGRPFLSILMEYVSGFGFKRFILSTGYKGEMIEKYFSSQSFPWEVVCSREKGRLGTGGAVKEAKCFIRTQTFLVLNGDSFCRISLGRFLDFHLKRKALLSIALTKIKDNENSGKVVLGDSGRIAHFKEKDNCARACFDSCGIYLMDQKIFSFMKEKKFSLEYDFFPVLTSQKCYGFKQKAGFVDFGTPAGYRKAERLFKKEFDVRLIKIAP